MHHRFNAWQQHSLHVPCSYLVFNKTNSIISSGMKALWPTCLPSHGNNLSLLIYVDGHILFFFIQTFTVDIHFLHISRFIHKIWFCRFNVFLVFGKQFFSSRSVFRPIKYRGIQKKFAMCFAISTFLPVGIFS